MRNNGRLLLFPGGLWMVAVIVWWAQGACRHQFALQHLCDFHGKLIIFGRESKGTAQHTPVQILENTEQLRTKIRAEVVTQKFYRVYFSPFR